MSYLKGEDILVRSTDEILNLLLDNISALPEVQSIGISRSKTPLPKAGEGDIDIFIYCNSLPALDRRQAIIHQLGDLLQEGKVKVFEGGHWGSGDFALINGVETWLMYFTIDETLADVEAILNGDYLDKMDNYYYPVGRCAMLRNINILYDETDFLNSLKKRLADYPDKLAEVLTKHHLDELGDIEDLERALIRKDVLFYHFALDIAVDHFLQALFAMNKTYFPSRKRTFEYINSFNAKPDRCNEKLLEVVRLGSTPEGIAQSYELWRSLVKELNQIDQSI